jgi:acyl-CoA synthetase (AMP-forming)/AMP-acid ligase II
MAKHTTLIHLLKDRAVETPGKIAFTFHNDPPETFEHLWQEINHLASYMLQQGLRSKERVIIAIPNSRLFFYAFYGVQLAGGVAVPVFPGSGPRRIIKLAGLCNAPYIIVSKNLPQSKCEELMHLADEYGGRVLFAEDSSGCWQGRRFRDVKPGDIAFIQFTSGSSGDSKGVQLTHGNLITNIRQMIAGMEITTDDIFVSWLPVYHDMGLILMTMVPFYLGNDLMLLPTGLNYLKSWLKAIMDRGGTFTAAPDFAYRLCLVYIRDPENYRLSSLRVALNAAEPVRSATIKRFEETFNLKNVLLPAYGLAEATVGVCSWKPGKEIKTDNRGFVSVGKPFPGVQMRISGENGPANAPNIGEILVKSAANTIGYCHNPGANEELFVNDGYIKTGDLGYVDETGDYYIVDREKNTIIHGGFNIAASEIEELTDDISFVRRSAAVGVDRGSAEGEQVYIFAEVGLKRSQLEQDSALTDLSVAVVQRFNATFGFRPGRVYLLKSGSIPMTYNGKIKHLELKELYLNGTLREKGRILFPEY